jgi:ADP-heptose:LPS heptosyltransferase
VDVSHHLAESFIFRYNPRIHSIIRIDDSFFPALDISSLDRGIVLKAEAIKLIHLLRSKHYDGVFPGNTTPFFYLRLHAPIMEIGVLTLFRDYLSLRSQGEIPVSQITRKAVNAFFGNRLPEPAADEEIPLYITSHHIQKAITVIESLKDQADISGKPRQVVMVAPDTSSFVTRPPTKLLAGGIAGALCRKHEFVVCILPGYTDRNAAQNLYESLSPRFSRRIFIIPHEPPLSLLETTALIDQAEILITGDTGTMHLAVAFKKLREEDRAYSPRNSRKVIVLFGGTNPGVHGYSQQTIILGRGRKEQSAVIPGIFKEAYNGKQRNFFDHITPQQLTDAIVSQLEAE